MSKFKNNPQDAGTKEIQPLLNSAINYLNAKYQVEPQTVRASVLGTAGMRMLPEATQTAIYQSVREAISSNNFLVGNVGTISGVDEAIYSWIDVNYLESNFSNKRTTTGVIEVGGASAQIVFVSEKSQATSKVKINGQLYALYASSFLGLGQDEAIKQMLTTGDLVNHACYPTDYVKDNLSGKFNFAQCSANLANVTNNYGESLNLIYQKAGFKEQNFVGVSSIWFTTSLWNIAEHPEQLEQQINDTCYLSWSEIQKKYPNNPFLSGQCVSATYINQLLYGSLHLSSQQLRSVNKINNNKLTWTLGYLLADFNKSN